MIFTSITFFVFFILFFLLHWFFFSETPKLQNLFILCASYLFYAWWDWRFLSILIGTSFLNFVMGIYIERSTTPAKRKLFLYLGLVEGIGALVLFKYYNFFISSFNEAFTKLNININLQLLNLIIPLGLSYFTFKTISYLLDVDKQKIVATKDWVVFFTYVSFFPCILAGPIDKARTFIPQLEKRRDFNYDIAADGMRQILWGLFKKLVIADNCATIVNEIFSNYQHLPGSTLVAGAFFYTFQMYADFSGYSDMAIGFSHLIGLNVTKNFNFPFFSENIAEFWRKWHISLTAWLTEYVFTPLSIAFRNLGKAGLILAIIINFTIVGIWHGANWTYVFFGFLHGCYFIPLILKGTMNKKKKVANKEWTYYLGKYANMLATFILVMLTFVVFRSDSMTQVFEYFKGLFSTSLFSSITLSVNKYKPGPEISLIFIILMLIVEWAQRDKEHGLQIDNKPAIYRWAIYTGIIFLMGIFMYSSEAPFIYLKF